MHTVHHKRSCLIYLLLAPWLALGAASGGRSSGAHISWTAAPALGGDTLLVHGSGLLGKVPCVINFSSMH